jgi:hypothetical protein
MRSRMVGDRPRTSTRGSLSSRACSKPSQKCAYGLPKAKILENSPRRPRDPAQLAKLMIDIASGEVEDRERTPEEQGKNRAAVELGRRGGALAALLG